MQSARNDVNPQPVTIGRLGLPGDLALPAQAHGLVVFAHGSGSSRKSPRNRQVAQALWQRGLGTLLFDLLSEAEAAWRDNVFQIPLLSERLLSAVSWVQAQPRLLSLPLGLFGASTGAAAALVAAAQRPDAVSAVVSRGGRPDMAEAALGEVRAPTLLIVGEADTGVLALNEQALSRMSCHARLALVPRATHLFEEPGALEQVCVLAGDWFDIYLQEGRHEQPSH